MVIYAETMVKRSKWKFFQKNSLKFALKEFVKDSKGSDKLVGINADTGFRNKVKSKNHFRN